MQVHFIRHGKTSGNEEKRYIGRTDEALSATGITEIEERMHKGLYPKADIVIHSGMKRTRETAELIYGAHREFVTEERLRECDFGTFEGKNYIELSGNTDYQKWIDSNGTLPFPNGEDREQFIHRCVDGFLSCIEKYMEYEQLVFCVHGGTIMAILSRLADDAACNQATGLGKTYYDYYCDNGGCLSYQVKYGDGIQLKDMNRNACSNSL